MEQGQVLLDTDLNEQSSIVLHYLRALAADLIGPHGGPSDGFKISRIPTTPKKRLTDLRIAPGHYYVGGILCENDDAKGVTYFKQPDSELQIAPLPTPPFLVYLDVWERYLTAAEDDSLLDPALGVETSSRMQVVWQVKLLPLHSFTHNKSKKRKTAKSHNEGDIA
jgi:hypothetical protein